MTILNPKIRCLFCHNALKFSLFLLLFTSCFPFFRKKNLLVDILLPDAKPIQQLLSPNSKLESATSQPRDPTTVSAIILHSSEKRKLTDYIRLSMENQFMIHIGIDKNGIVYADPDFLKKSFLASPGIDKESIHIAYEGTQENILANQSQFSSLRKTVDQLSEDLGIPKSNFDIIGKRGIFTHNQAKRRFGGFVDFSMCGGEKLIELMLTELKGNFYDEDHWKDRYESGWVLKKENKQKLQENFNPTNGRGITKPIKSSINSIEKDEKGFPIESYRVRYTHRGRIDPTCIVLHYTAIPDYFQSLRTLENRNLTATLMVDKDGKAYQLVDELEERAAAATGTNDNCIQIEIVARDTAELIAQTAQTEKVKNLVLDLTSKYRIPLNNEDIATFSGIFSHTQAKKKWGGSIFLNAKDFDPGEEYMELILNSIGGKYFSETKWKNRDSFDWAILSKNFQP
ncbi:peptidoglycan recognition protein family protein [Leptospira ognonensis]|uniref:peptidoglycan recognition protein family protein n=1 Tax=Leptospira ognonensis TaxID=2484945 RepID=UPI001FE3DD1E|nr:peptidoglycan recognition family protein [Leptospira ognonensis]